MKILETWGLGGVAGKRPAPPISRAAAVITALLAPFPAAANDGFYVGGHVGYMFGNATATFGDPAGRRRPAGIELDRPALRRRAGRLPARHCPSR